MLEPVNQEAASLWKYIGLIAAIAVIASIFGGCAEGRKFRVAWNPPEQAISVNGHMMTNPPSEGVESAPVPSGLDEYGVCLHVNHEGWPSASGRESDQVAVEVRLKSEGLYGHFHFGLESSGETIVTGVSEDAAATDYVWTADLPSPGSGISICLIED